MQLKVTIVPSMGNKADALMLVPQRRLKMPAASPTASSPMCAAAAEATVEQLMSEIHHSRGHPGVRRTRYFVKRVNLAISK